MRLLNGWNKRSSRRWERKKMKKLNRVWWRPQSDGARARERAQTIQQMQKICVRSLLRSARAQTPYLYDYLCEQNTRHEKKKIIILLWCELASLLTSRQRERERSSLTTFRSWKQWKDKNPRWIWKHKKPTHWLTESDWLSDSCWYALIMKMLHVRSANRMHNFICLTSDYAIDAQPDCGICECVPRLTGEYYTYIEYHLRFFLQRPNQPCKKPTRLTQTILFEETKSPKLLRHEINDQNDRNYESRR